MNVKEKNQFNVNLKNVKTIVQNYIIKSLLQTKLELRPNGNEEVNVKQNPRAPKAWT